MKVNISVDMEHDCPPYTSTYHGVEQGTPRLLDLLAREDVPATFFTTGDVARRYPEVVQRIVAAGHELGCHGDTHTRFSQLDAEQARREIADASHVLRAFGPVTSFRAPALDFPPQYVGLLQEAGYTIDSSQPTIESWYTKPNIGRDFSRLPASVPPWVLRTMPTLLLGKLLCQLYRLADRPVVLYVHPWEFVDNNGSPMRFQSRVFTGERVVRGLESVIQYLKSTHAHFYRVDALVAALRRGD